jgi:hypothetical protein
MMGIVGFIFIIMLFTAVILTLGAIIAYFDYWIKKKLKEERIKKGVTSQMFLDYFLEKGIDQKLCKVVYEYFQEWQKVKNFPVMPQDHIAKIYGIEYDEIILKILARYINIPVKDVAIENLIAIISLPEIDIQTIDDLVMALWKYLSSQPIKIKPAK